MKQENSEIGKKVLTYRRTGPKYSQKSIRVDIHKYLSIITDILLDKFNLLHPVILTYCLDYYMAQNTPKFQLCTAPYRQNPEEQKKVRDYRQVCSCFFSVLSFFTEKGRQNTPGIMPTISFTPFFRTPDGVFGVQRNENFKKQIYIR